MGTETRSIETPDGRTLCVEIGGEGDRAIVVHNGTPNSRLLFAPWVDDAAARGARLIGYDRPGYGGSTAQPGRTVADAAADTQAIAAALGLERVAVWGFSGGGPHAIACAALLPELVTAVGVVGSIAPWGADGLDYFAGMGEANVEGMNLYFEDPEASRRQGLEEREAMLGLEPADLVEAWRSLVSPVDEAAVQSGFAEHLVAAIRDGLAPDDEGWWEDGVAHLDPWGVDLDAIRIPVKVWHGVHDRFVPVSHGEWLAAHIPGAEAEISPEDGHLSLVVDGVPAIHEWLLAA